MDNKQTDKLIKKYFQMWVDKTKLDLTTIFTKDIQYTECYGPQYKGIDELYEWINRQFRIQTVTDWTIKNIFHDKNVTIVEWHFACTQDNDDSSFDGISIIKFKDDLISEVSEFESKDTHRRPYQK